MNNETTPHKYLDRDLYLRYRTLSKKKLFSTSDVSNLIINDESKKIYFHESESHDNWNKRRKRFFDGYRKKLSGVSKLQKNLKYEKNKFLREYYFGKLENLRDDVLLDQIRLDETITNEQRNQKVFEIQKKHFPIPSEEEFDIFISEFIDFLNFLNESNYLKDFDRKIFEEISNPDFYKIKYQNQKINFDEVEKNYKKNLKIIKEIGDERFNAEQIKKIIRKLLDELNTTEKVRLRIYPLAFLFSVLPEKRRVTIPSSIKMKKSRLFGIISHEVIVHLYRSILGLRNVNSNGEKMYALQTGSANSLLDEEGIATYFEQNIFSQSSKYDIFQLIQFYLRLIAIDLAIHFEPYDVYQKLIKLCEIQSQINPMLGKNPIKSAEILVKRLYRGYKHPSKGFFNPKIGVYLQGNRKIWNFIESGGNIANLFAGKIKIEDIESVKKMGFKIPEEILGVKEFPRKQLLAFISKSIS